MTNPWEFKRDWNVGQDTSRKAPDMLSEEIGRLSDPRGEIARRLRYADPQLQRILASVRTDLNRRGLYSAAPMGRATAMAGQQFTSNIAGQTLSEYQKHRIMLMMLRAQLQQRERESKRADDDSGMGELMGALMGTAIGAAV